MSVISREARFLSLMDTLPLDFVRDQYIKKVLFEKSRPSDARDRLAADGFEPVHAEQGAVALDDGRPVLWAFGASWALRMDIHLAHVAAAMEEARHAPEGNDQVETKSVNGTEALSVMTCPKCGDALQHTAVCPSCAAGRLGYRHRYACVCGGADLISREAL